MSIAVGISGWTYEGWRGTFYPKKLPREDELYYASRRLSSIEINGTFYSLKTPRNYQHWWEVTPVDFVFSVKANRYITHVKRLYDVEEPMANFLASGLLCLEEKLGPILWQLPPSMRFDPDRFEHFLALLPRDTRSASRLARKTTLPADRTSILVQGNRPLRHAVEIRHDSFLNPWYIELLRKYEVAPVLADTAGRWPYLEDVTSDFLYLRLHGEGELYVSGYDEQTLEFWAQRIRQWSQGFEPNDRLTLTESIAPVVPRDVYVYFDNDAKVRAPVDARTLIRKLSLAPGLLDAKVGLFSEETPRSRNL